MFSFSFWTILRIIYSLLFTIACGYISNFIQAIEAKKKCPLSEGWRITNGKILSSLLMIIGTINVFIPASKFLSTLPIIGSSYVLLFVLAVFVLLFIMNRLSINISERDDRKCKISGYGYDEVIEFFNNRNVMECIYITVGVSVIFFYL
jgi:protein-S-isoprenylcysteine O-methyltransferase Ste14